MASSSRSSTRSNAASQKPCLRADALMGWTEHVLELIFDRLPVNLRCRFRCLSRRWKEFLSSPSSVPLPSCMVTNGDSSQPSNDPNVTFFCHSRRKWFSLPSSNDPSFRLMWEEQHQWDSASNIDILDWIIADIDAGLICYYRATEFGFQLCVRNPLTNFFQFILFELPNPPSRYKDRGGPVVKLHVDREKKFFKVLVVLDDVKLTVIYDSATRCWDGCEDCPMGNYDGIGWLLVGLFVWKDVFHCCSVNRRGAAEVVVESFVKTEGKWVWDEVETELPCVPDHLTRQCIKSHKNEVVLVEASFRRRLHVSVWRLRTSKPNDSSDFSISQWEKIAIRRGPWIEKFARCRLRSVCCGSDYICITFIEVPEDEVDSFNNWSEVRCRAVRYSFRDKSWAEDIFSKKIRCRTEFIRRQTERLHPWEPSLAEDIFPGPAIDVHTSERLIRMYTVGHSTPAGEPAGRPPHEIEW